MSITTNQGGFAEATLKTECFAEMYALRDGSAFNIGWEKDEPFYMWDEAGCREAAKFFTMLADELKRREVAGE